MYICRELTVATMAEEQNEYTRKHHAHPLLLAGKLAMAARLVTTANAKNLSKRIEEMEIALDDYDNIIIKRTGK